MSTVKMDYDFHITTGRKGRKRLQEGKAALSSTGNAPTKISPAARQLALAYYFDRLIESGEAKDYADLARRFVISRARVTQIMNRLLMPVGEQERMLGG